MLTTGNAPNWPLILVIAVVVIGIGLLLYRKDSAGRVSLTAVSGLVIGAILVLIMTAGERVQDYAMPALLVIVSIGIFVLLMVRAAELFQRIDIADASQPFGLPAGTIRAVLTIAFVVLIGVFGSYILSSTQSRPGLVPVTGLDGTVMTAAEIAQVRDSLGEGFVVASKSTADPDKFALVVLTRPDHATADDLSKQIINMLLTLVTAMIGFYFGARIDAPSATTPVTKADLFPRSEAAAKASEAAAAEVEAARKTYGDKLQGDLAAQFEKISGRIEAARLKIQETGTEADVLIAAPQPDAQQLAGNAATFKVHEKELAAAMKELAQFKTDHPPG